MPAAILPSVHHIPPASAELFRRRSVARGTQSRHGTPVAELRPMKPLPRTAELERVARRLVWSEAPAKALADPVRLLAYASTYGTHEDMHTLRRYLGDEDLREALDRAPPGIFDPRSSTGTSCSTAGRRRRCRSGSCRSGRRD